jgi:2-haloacid dehalogenase
VFLDWNPRYLYRKLFADEAQMEDFLANVCTTDWNLRQDAGRTWDEAVAELSGRFPHHTPLIEAYHHRWPEMITRFFDGTVKILEELKAKGPVYSITNFSSEKFALAQQLWPFLTLFDGIVVSGDVKLVKPDAAIYRRLLDDFALEAQTCVFIDDVSKNVDAARAVGMRGILFKNPEELRVELGAIGLL